MPASLLRWTLLALLVVTARGANERIDAGPLVLDVHVSRTATLFHVVDQASEWSYFCHRQYGRLFAPLGEADRAELEKHKTVRAKHSWGEGLEQTFYTPLPLDDALKNGVGHGWLSAEEAATEREVLLHFASRIDALLDNQSAGLAGFREKLRQELGTRVPLLRRIARFTGTTPGTIPVYLLPNPDGHNFGGGYNGGRLTVEVPLEADAIPTTLHELFHAFLEGRKHDLETAATKVEGLDAETLNEGLAYAFAPGIVHRGAASSDPLADQVARDRAAGKPITDALTRSNRYGLALRPLLRIALDDDRQTLDSFLPRAVDVWRALYELDRPRSEELQTVTIIALYKPGAPELPGFVRNAQGGPPTELFAACREWVNGTYTQMRDFSRRASHDFILVSPGHPDVRARLDGHTVSTGDGTFQAYGLKVLPEDRDKIAPGTAYKIKPLNTNDTYRWQVAEDFKPIVLRDQ